MLLLGGFSIAAALSKHYIAKAMATWVLLKVGQKPSNVLLASMFVAMFASMWISNVAAPALCFSLLQPILRTLETGDCVSRSLVLGESYFSTFGPPPKLPLFWWELDNPMAALLLCADIACQARRPEV